MIGCSPRDSPGECGRAGCTCTDHRNFSMAAPNFCASHSSFKGPENIQQLIPRRHPSTPIFDDTSRRHPRGYSRIRNIQPPVASRPPHRPQCLQSSTSRTSPRYDRCDHDSLAACDDTDTGTTGAHWTHHGHLQGRHPLVCHTRRPRKELGPKANLLAAATFP